VVFDGIWGVSKGGLERPLDCSGCWRIGGVEALSTTVETFPKLPHT
jgi:hypothetical protein